MSRRREHHRSLFVLRIENLQGNASVFDEVSQNFRYLHRGKTGHFHFLHIIPLLGPACCTVGQNERETLPHDGDVSLCGTRYEEKGISLRQLSYRHRQ